MKAIDESEGMMPEALEQAKRELLLLQGTVVANVEKKLRPSVGQHAHLLPSPLVYLKPALSNSLASPIG